MQPGNGRLVRVRQNTWPALAVGFLVASLAVSCEPIIKAQDAGPDAALDAGDTGSDSDSDADGDGGGGDAAPDASADAGDGGTDTDSGDGTCESTGVLEPGIPTPATTVGATNDLDSYNCTELDESGPDIAYEYVNESADPQKVIASLTGLETDLDLFLLLPSCDVESCLAHSASLGDETATAIVDAGQILYLVVDGFQGAQGEFVLQIQVAPIESICDDEIDDDEDSLTDCADDDCLLSPACIQTCTAEGPIACGDTISGTTSTVENSIEVYSSYAVDFTGPERIFAFIGETIGTTVEAQLVNAPPDIELLVLAEECASDAAVLNGPTNATFAPVPALEYFIIIDGRNGATGSFDLALTCRESICDDAVDNDSDGLIDCADLDCELEAPCIVPCEPLVTDGGCATTVDAGPSDAGAIAPACYPLLPDPVAGFCHEPGDGDVGAPCVMPYDCTPGTTCVPADICLRYCDIDDGIPGCDAGVCTSMGVDPLGVCWD